MRIMIIRDNFLNFRITEMELGIRDLFRKIGINFARDYMTHPLIPEYSGMGRVRNHCVFVIIKIKPKNNAKN